LPGVTFAQGLLNVDPSFGANGVAAFDFYDSWDRCTGSHHYADNRILLVGYAQDGNGARRVLALARMLPNGQPDPNFGVQGKTTLDYTGLNNSGVVKVVDPVVLSDGSIIIPMTYNTGNNVRRVLTKLRPN